VLGDQVETLPELALRFCLSAPEVSTVIPGMRRPTHVRQNTLASTRHARETQAACVDKNWYSD